MSVALYNRLRAVCCSEWGVSPVAFDELADGGRVALEDVLESVVLRGFGPLGDLRDYLMREQAVLRRSKLERMKGLMLQLQATSDPEKRAKLAAMMNELNGVK